MTQNEYGGEEKGETMGLSRGLTSNVRPKGCEKRIPNSGLRTYTQPRPSLMNVTLHDMRERALLCYLEKDRSDVTPIELVAALPCRRTCRRIDRNDRNEKERERIASGG